MLQFGRKNGTVTYGAIIDVGSGSVGVGILKSDHQKKLPEILYSHREPMRVGKTVDRDEKIRQMREALFSASLALSTEGLKVLGDAEKGVKIKRILVTCASPWAHTVSRNILFHNDEEVRITSSLIQNLINDTEKEIEGSLDESAVIGKLGLHVVERATVSAKVNGYLIHNPANLRGTDVELSQIMGLVPEEVLEAVYEVQEKILVDTKLSAHTFMLVDYCVLKDLFPKTDSLTIINVTGESTEIGVVENGILVGVKHAPYGSYTLLRNASRLGGNPEHVHSTLRGYVEKTLSDAQLKETEGLVEKYRTVVSDAFKEFHKDKNIPHTFAITAAPQLEAFYKKILPEIAGSTLGGKYTVLEIKDKDSHAIPSPPETDVFILLASRFFHKLHGCGEIDTL